MKTNRLTPPETEMIFGFTRAEFEALERPEISDARLEELLEYFCGPSKEEDEAETYNKFVEECGGL
jgi:hypothetical protein